MMSNSRTADRIDRSSQVFLFGALIVLAHVSAFLFYGRVWFTSFPRPLIHSYEWGVTGRLNDELIVPFELRSTVGFRSLDLKSGMFRDIDLPFFRPFKGLDLALEAWKQVAPDVFLLAAGEAWWKGGQHYRALAEGLPNARMEFRYIPDSEVATYFAAADVVLAPYRTEAQSGVALTAFHFGRPVIATRVGGLPEVIEDGVNGLLVPPEDPAALATAVNRFFTDCDRTAMEAAATETARLCSWEDYGALFSRLVHRT